MTSRVVRLRRDIRTLCRGASDADTARRSDHDPLDRRWCRTHHLILFEELLADFSKIHGKNSDLPACIVAAHWRAHCSSDDLMAKADADYSDAILAQQFLCELNQLDDPRIVVK